MVRYDTDRQTTRDSAGRYSEMTPCNGECGKRLSRDGNYWSHQLSDTVDADGRGFDDAGLLLCEKCAKACANQTTLREFGQFVQANLTRRGLPIPGFIPVWIDGGRS